MKYLLMLVVFLTASSSFAAPVAIVPGSVATYIFIPAPLDP